MWRLQKQESDRDEQCEFEFDDILSMGTNSRRNDTLH